jgi:serine/threonine protein kinase
MILISFIMQFSACTNQMMETFMAHCYFLHYVDELRGLEWNTRYGIIRGICEGLHHLHTEKHIYHMDLKPGNILLDNDMVPKITDFGLSRLDEKSKTMSEDRLGSL